MGALFQWIEAYRLGLGTCKAQVQVQKSSSTKYKSHRCIPEGVASIIVSLCTMQNWVQTQKISDSILGLMLIPLGVPSSPSIEAFSQEIISGFFLKFL